MAILTFRPKTHIDLFFNISTREITDILKFHKVIYNTFEDMDTKISEQNGHPKML